MKTLLNKSTSNLLVKFILDCKQGIIVEDAEDEKIDFVVKADSETYAIFTRYRNFPLQETKSRTLRTDEEERIENICKDNMIPVIAYTFFDEGMNKIYVMIMTLNKMQELVNADNVYLNQVLHGMDIKLGVGKMFREELFHELKREVCTAELEIRNLNQIFQ